MYKYPSSADWPRDREHLVKFVEVAHKLLNFVSVNDISSHRCLFSVFAQGGYKELPGEATPLPPDLIAELILASTQLASALPYYMTHPTEIRESEWGFLFAGSLMGTIFGASLFALANSVFGTKKRMAFKED